MCSYSFIISLNINERSLSILVPVGSWYPSFCCLLSISPQVWSRPSTAFFFARAPGQALFRSIIIFARARQQDIFRNRIFFARARRQSIFLLLVRVRRQNLFCSRIFFQECDSRIFFARARRWAIFFCKSATTCFTIRAYLCIVL